MKKYVVDLSEEEREQLEVITTKGESKARRLRRAHIRSTRSPTTRRSQWRASMSYPFSW